MLTCAADSGSISFISKQEQLIVCCRFSFCPPESASDSACADTSMRKSGLETVTMVDMDAPQRSIAAQPELAL